MSKICLDYTFVSKEIIDRIFELSYGPICDLIEEQHYCYTDVHYVGYYLNKISGQIKFDVRFNKYDLYTGVFLGVGSVLYKEELYDEK